MKLARPVNYLIYNDKPITEFDTYISGEGSFSSPERDYETVEIPGRNGDLIWDNGRYKNVAVSYESWILAETAEEFEEKFKRLVNHLSSDFAYHKLEDTYHPDTYRMAMFSGPIEISELTDLRAGRFTLQFNARPQRYLKSGEIPKIFSENGVIHNPTRYESRPIIRIYGTGSFVVNNETITVSDTSEFDYIDLDCENMEAFCEDADANAFISFATYDPIVLSPGDNQIELTDSTIDRVVIWGRWWEL